jgi:hypothetical protein
VQRCPDFALNVRYRTMAADRYFSYAVGLDPAGAMVREEDMITVAIKHIQTRVEPRFAFQSFSCCRAVLLPARVCMRASLKLAKPLPYRFPAVGTCRMAEWWAQWKPHHAGHELHFDSVQDPATGRIRTPIVSTVLYLSDTVGGATLVTDQALDSDKMAQTGYLCDPHVNRLLYFAGNLLHGVVPAPGPPPAQVLPPPLFFSSSAFTLCSSLPLDHSLSAAVAENVCVCVRVCVCVCVSLSLSLSVFFCNFF